MRLYESDPITRFRRDVFLACRQCGHVFINTVSSGTFCRRCRGADLKLWKAAADADAAERRARARRL